MSTYYSSARTYYDYDEEFDVADNGTIVVACELNGAAARLYRRVVEASNKPEDEVAAELLQRALYVTSLLDEGYVMRFTRSLKEGS